MITEHHIKIEKSARYAVLMPKDDVKSVLFAIHGYRQLAPYFIKQFQALADLGVMVIAPEGLHRFYIEGYSGRVGASWMTKEDRETDIEDYVGYLNALYASISIDLKELPIHLLGFSQGGPTACRWLAASEVPFQSLILYSTVFPNDFDFSIHQDILNIPIEIAFGDDDVFAPEKIITEKMKWLEEKGVKPKLQRFQGGHEILPQVLHSIWEEISTV